jgi:hypothetical protein
MLSKAQVTPPHLHLDKTTQDLVYQLVQKYWSVFDDKGQFVPIKDYSCIIVIGSAWLIAVKKIHYGPRETPIMQKCIAFLAKLGHIWQVHGGEWLFKALLAPKPHQVHLQNIDDVVWQFCVIYIPLNEITKPVAYPIPRCDSADFLTFGGVCGCGCLMHPWVITKSVLHWNPR